VAKVAGSGGGALSAEQSALSNVGVYQDDVPVQSVTLGTLRKKRKANSSHSYRLEQPRRLAPRGTSP
jgi:hypothetical protein